MKYRPLIVVLVALALAAFTEKKKDPLLTYIRINQLGYTPGGIKVAVLCSKAQLGIASWRICDAKTGKVVFITKLDGNMGAYGPFIQTHRLNFSSYKTPGRYYIEAGDTRSPEFEIGEDVYKGAADFCLRYMRQQRTGFNPYLKDSCHTRDGYVLYGKDAGIPDSTRIDVVGGWHDASDYLQYSTTSANATYHLLMAYRDFPQVFGDLKQANGLDGKNGIPDVVDEAKWGLDWLMKMNPNDSVMFNQIADDRDHMGMRIPKQDSFYGRGHERPVYFVSGKPQQRGKFMNNTTGTSSTAGKFASAFALAHSLYVSDSVFGKIAVTDGYMSKAVEAYLYGLSKPGFTQTASVKSPYIYAEENWSDDMELAAAALSRMFMDMKEKSNMANTYLGAAAEFSGYEKITPWLGTDTAKHYQWYPFINIGHYELARQIIPITKRMENSAYKEWGVTKQTRSYADSVVSYYKQGVERVWNKAKSNAFYRGIPFIWCSNNLTVAFTQQCYWYRELTGDRRYEELEQANFDWLFGCNPWGTSMVYGLPSWGDTPVDPHSAFTHLKNYPIDGGLVDGPVYGSIYKSLIGIQLKDPDEYEHLQSNLAVYHDDYGDYSTNEPTMDGTASLIYLLAAKEAESKSKKRGLTWHRGAITRGDSTRKEIALVFTGDEFADGGTFIAKTLKEKNVKASFFFTGRFYRNKSFAPVIKQLKQDGHYLGAHSDQHLLYCDWSKRDSLLVTKQQFKSDLLQNYAEMKKYGIEKSNAQLFLPPYEWYNDSIAAWTKAMGLQLINFTPGTISHADYTKPTDKNYRSSEAIFHSITGYEQVRVSGLNGFILLVHIGTDPRRTDKFYSRLGELLDYANSKGYRFLSVTELLK